MSAYLKQQIQDRMEAKGLTIYGLEKKAGLNRSAVRNILQDMSKNPGLGVLKSIAIALDCTLDDLVGHEEDTSVPANRRAQPSCEWHADLYLETVRTMDMLMSQAKRRYDLQRMTQLIQEAYQYALKKGENRVDLAFCHWMIDRTE